MTYSEMYMTAGASNIDHIANSSAYGQPEGSLTEEELVYEEELELYRTYGGDYKQTPDTLKATPRA